MGFNEYAFYISWDAIMLVASIPLNYFALKIRWEYKGKKDRIRTYAMLLATISFFLEFLFELAADAYTDRPSTDSEATFIRTTSAFEILSETFNLMSLLATAFVFLRTAVAFMYGMSGGQKLGLIRIIELVGAAGFVMLVVLAVVVWCIYIWYITLLKFYVDDVLAGADQEGQGQPYDNLNHAYLIQARIAVAYEWIYFAFATIFLPIVFLQTLGRRTDRVAILLFTFAIMLVDALHVLEVVRNLVSINKHDPLAASSHFDVGIAIAVLVANSLFELLALYCLSFMGMRDPKRLTGDDEPAFAPVAQHPQEQWPEDTKYDPAADMKTNYTAELPAHGSGSSGFAELPSDNAINAELPGDSVARPEKSSSKLPKFLKRG